jgi:hypothetical protein
MTITHCYLRIYNNEGNCFSQPDMQNLHNPCNSTLTLPIIMICGGAIFSCFLLILLKSTLKTLATQQQKSTQLNRCLSHSFSSNILSSYHSIAASSPCQEKYETVPKLCQLWIKTAKINQTHQDDQNWEKANKNKGFARIPYHSRTCDFTLNRFTKPLLYL